MYLYRLYEKIHINPTLYPLNRDGDYCCHFYFGFGGGFAFIVVLLILLIIVGYSCFKGGRWG
ncbi:YjcZ family sporulation protein [Peribacillus simplex]|uniref:YjcZ family sporulation protein n=1 Tax=Peribacillus simplex TaxID=1478 RepID=UPI003D29D1A6